MTSTFYRRPLPSELVAFSSEEGRRLFREALSAGTMEGYFPLSEQFHTQADPAFCGLGSLVVVLNALGVDPGRLWKGPWRWFDESLLDCCVPLDVVAKRGVTLGELSCLAECNGATPALRRAGAATADDLRRDVLAASRAPRGPVVIAGYDRAALGQTGAGHFSPVGGYHEGRDLALLLDVARFKYPPHWVPLTRLFEAMEPIDAGTGRPRGWLTLTAAAGARPIFLRMTAPPAGWRPLVDDVRATMLAAGQDAPEDWVRLLVDRAGALDALVTPLAESLGAAISPEHGAEIEALLAEVRATEAFSFAARALPAETSQAAPLAPEVIAVLSLVLAPEAAPIGGGALASEVAALRRQLRALCAPGP